MAHIRQSRPVPSSLNAPPRVDDLGASNARPGGVEERRFESRLMWGLGFRV